MVLICVDYALHQLSLIQDCHHELNSTFDYSLSRRTRDFVKDSLGCISYTDFQNPIEISEFDVYSEQAYLQVLSCMRELMFFKMIFWCSPTTLEDDHTHTDLIFMLSTLGTMWEDLEERIDDSIMWKSEPAEHDWDLLPSLLEGAIQQCKPLIVDYCQLLLDSLDSSWQCKALPSDQAFQFLQLVLQNLEVLVKYKADVIPAVKLQIDSLKVRLILSCSFFRLITAHGDIESDDLRSLEVILHSFAYNAACLTFLFWAEAEDEETTFETKINELLSDMRQKIIEPSDDTALFMGALKAIKLRPSDDTLLHGQVVDMHLYNLVAASKDDCRVVRDAMIFLLTFVSNPPQRCDHEDQLILVYNQIHILFSKCKYLILSPNIMKERLIMDAMLLSDFAEKLEVTMDKVKQLHVKTPDWSSYHFPRTNGLGFYDFLLQNLESLKQKQDTNTTYIPFAKNYITKINEELVSLRPLVNAIFELKKQQKEFEDTWSQVINLAYSIEHVINSCAVCLHPVWYNMACLSDILLQIENVKTKLHYIKVRPGSLKSSSTTPRRMHFSTTSEEVITLKEETEKLIDELIGGFDSLGIVSIIGMGGLRKTTLARKVYYSRTVRYHFHIFGFCSVSQVLNRRNLFLDLLSDITDRNKDQFEFMTEDDLAHKLWKSLSGQRYLVVIDDIWDPKAWDKVKECFPNDQMGSRVIFTTQDLKVALDAKSNLHELRFLRDDESFELLRMKAFGKDNWPPKFSGVGELIAKNCKGLPLAIVVVAGLLAGNQTSPSLWEEIAEATCQFVGKGCKDIIGLSYKHLLDHLKSCFLYMSIYGEDELIETDRLRQLWICEGFVKKCMKKRLRNVSKEYLSNLVERNLVTAVGRTRGGGVGTCRLHDLIRDFCRRKAEEDNFFWLRDGYETSHSPVSTICNMYRVCIGRNGSSFDDVEPTVVGNIHSLICLRRTKISKLVKGNSKLVQVLDLGEYDEFLFSNQQVHLRYLSISQRQWFCNVPESISNFCSLETLSISSTDPIKLPKTIWKMKRLRHLEFPQGCVLDLGEDEEGCHKILENMEFLSDLFLSDERTARAILRGLPNLQKLTCFLIGSEWKGKVFAIDYSFKLESLSLRLGKTVPRFPPTLKRLKIRAFGSFLMMDLSAIGELPCLEVLKLHGDWKQWDVEDNQFHKLKCLELEMKELGQWNISVDSFSCLEQLDLYRCFSLKEISACFGELTTLQVIKVTFCNKKLECSAVQVQEEQMECGNKMQVEIISK